MNRFLNFYDKKGYLNQVANCRLEYLGQNELPEFRIKFYSETHPKKSIFMFICTLVFLTKPCDFSCYPMRNSRSPLVLSWLPWQLILALWRLLIRRPLPTLKNPILPHDPKTSSPQREYPTIAFPYV